MLSWKDLSRTKPWVLVTALLVINLFFSRWVFFFRFDLSYVKNLFEHSQWSIDQSPRIMGDGDLYAYAGYLLAQGGQIFNVNPETPPLVKYFFGFATHWSSNPFLVSVGFYLLTLLIFYFLARLIFKENFSSILLSIFLFLIAPFFTAQITQLGLDLPQLFFLLAHVYFLFLAVSDVSPTLKYAAISGSGVALGFFSATKIAVYSPFIFLLAAAFLWRAKQLRLSLPFAFASGIGFLLPYTHFFLSGNSLLDWLKTQKWVLDFYLDSQISSIPLMIFFTTFTGVFIGWWENSISFTREWSLILPVGLLSFFAASYFFVTKRIVLKKNQQWRFLTEPIWQYLLSFIAFYFIINSILPFWPRYLLLIVPFFIFIIVQVLTRYQNVWRVFLVLCSIQYLFFLFPQPNDLVTEFSNNWKAESYADLYNSLGVQSQNEVPRYEFANSIRQLHFDLQATKSQVLLRLPTVLPWQNQVTGESTITYDTPLGEITHNSPVTLVKEHGKWRMTWQWSILFPQFTKNTAAVTQLDPIIAGKILSSDKIILSEGGEREFLSVIPAQIENEKETLEDIKEVTGIGVKDLRVRLYVLAIPEYPTPIGMILPTYSDTVLQRLKTRPGIVVTKKYGRVYSANLPDSKLIPIIQEKENENRIVEGKQGGSVFLIEKNSDEVSTRKTETAVFTRPTEHGKNVTLVESYKDLFGVEYFSSNASTPSAITPK